MWTIDIIQCCFLCEECLINCFIYQKWTEIHWRWKKGERGSNWESCRSQCYKNVEGTTRSYIINIKGKPGKVMIKNVLIRRKRAIPTWLLSVDFIGVRGLRRKKMKYCSFEPALRPSSSADEGRSASWKLQYFIFFHCNPRILVMSTDSSQVGVALFPSY